MNPIEETSWIGGQSTDGKHAPDHSFRSARHLDFRKKASSLTVLPGMTEDTGGIIQAVPLNMIEVEGEKFYVGDEAGNVYLKEAGLWSQLAGNIGNFEHGMAYIRSMDSLFMACRTTISRVKNAGENFGSPTLEADILGPSVDHNNVAGAANNYNVPNALNETVTHRHTWTPTTEPLYSIKVKLTLKGTGNLTVYVHDSANNLLGSKTLTNAELALGTIEFVFATPLRQQVAPSGSAYHCHFVYAAGTQHNLEVATAADLETATLSSWADRLVGGDLEHPMIQFLQYLCICNERYLSVWEPITIAPLDTEYLRHRLVFRPQDQSMAVALWADYLAIGCGTWSNNTNGIEAGRIYFWTGFSKTYDQVLEIPEGAPQSLFSHLNRLYWIAAGIWYTWAGGDIEKVWQFPHTDTEYKSLPGPTYVYPNMMAVRNGILLTAFPNDTADPEIEYGVYSFGRREKDYPLSSGYSYSISTGTRQNVTPGVSLVQLGFLKSFGSDLYLGWADYSGTPDLFGIDLVSPSTTPASSGVYESLIRDDGRPRKQKGAAELYVTFEPLPTGSTITPKYKIDRADDWSYGEAGEDPKIAVAGDVEVRLNINKRYKEIEYGFDWTCGATTFEITCVELIRNYNLDEAD
jgi:hypothetical protein